MSPPVTSSSPAIIRSVVVFPHPEGPTRTRNSWSRTVRSMPATATTSPKRFSTFSRTTSATGHGKKRRALSRKARRLRCGSRLDGTKLLLGLFHRDARILALADLREHRRHDELRVHRGRGLGHRAGEADELDVLLVVLEELELGFGADHRHRLLEKRLQVGMVVSRRSLHSLQAVLVHRVEELLGEVLVLGETVDAVGHCPGAADAHAR